MNVNFSKKFILIMVLATVIIVTALVTGQTEFAQEVWQTIVGTAVR